MEVACVTYNELTGGISLNNNNNAITPNRSGIRSMKPSTTSITIEIAELPHVGNNFFRAVLSTLPYVKLCP